MTAFRRSFMMMSTALIVTVFLAACGGVQGTNTANMPNNTMGTSTTTAYTTPIAQATMGNSAITPTTGGNMNGNNGGNMNAFIHTAVVTLNGKQVHVLTTNKGFMLYYYKKDTMLTSSCTGTCAQNWPPLLAPQGMMTINSSIMLPKPLSVHKTANGNQVFYDGHALYTYAGDMQPGQFSGRAMGNVWYLVGINL